MVRKYLKNTHFQGLRRIGVRGRYAQDSWEQIDAHIEAALSPEHARIFAEPVVSADGTMDWYGAGDGEARTMEELPESERVELLARFRKLHTEIRAHAEGLQASKSESGQRIGAIIEAALSFSAQDGQPLPLTAMGSQPVLTNWGTQLDSPVAPPDPLEDFVKSVDRSLPKRKKKDSEPVDQTLVTPPIIQQEIVEIHRPVSIWAWLSWLLFAALLIILFLMLLAPCGIAVLTGSRLCPGINLQSAPTNSRIPQLISEVDGLEDALRHAPFCAVSGATPPEQEEMSEADRRREEAGGQTGELTITLTWENTSDLDLHVYCANNHLYFGSRRQCGGELDVDANVGVPTTTTPIENVFFETMPTYPEIRVSVDNYSDRSGRGSTDYRLEVVLNGEREVYTGRLRDGEMSNQITVRIP